MRKDLRAPSWPRKARRVLGWRDDSDEQCLARRDRRRRRAVHAAGVHRRAIREVDGRPGVRAQALRHPQAGGECIRYAGKVDGGEYFYVSSLSYKTVIYKGMLMPEQVAKYYPDLRDPAMDIGAGAGAFALFSTNTFPSWDRAHPYRYHRAQRRNQHAARQHQLDARARRRISSRELFGDDIKKILPVINTDGSDSAHVRQLPRTARHGGPRTAARDDDDDSRAVGKSREHGRRRSGRFTNIIPA